MNLVARFLQSGRIPSTLALQVVLASVALLLGCAHQPLCGRDALEDKRDACPATITSESPRVKVTATREGEVTHFFVHNDELCEICMTFEMGLTNLKPSSALPCTATFPPKQNTEAFSLSPIESGKKWEYSYTNYYKLGSNSARHNDAYLYQLPYAPGHKFSVTQGYNGSFSHKGSNRYAIDWKMPEGTFVCAARGGVVVKVKDDSGTGGSSIKYDKDNNYVLIRHEDGTLGHYCHLLKNGCLVKVGQTVQAGTVIARSGNTGFSSGPHLHFCVFRVKDGRERESIPVKFQTADQSAVTLTTGHSYTASTLKTASTTTAQPVGASMH